MYLLYSLALSALFVLLLPYFIYQAVRHGKYANSFRQRLGRLPGTLRADDRPTLWVHTVSVGEFLAARPLIEKLREEFADWRVIVSTTTLTGQQLAHEHQPGRFDGVCYFPFDWTFSVRRALDHLKPSLVVILETELWPNFLRECRRRQIITIIANGRISPRSFGRYRRVSGFIGRVLKDISLLVMQSEADAERVRSLGADTLQVCGNLKYDVPMIDCAAPPADSIPASDPTPPTDSIIPVSKDAASDIADEINRQFALASSGRLIVAGSTAPGEEKMLLAAFAEIRRQPGLEAVRLLIAPRHPERFNEVAGLIAQTGFRHARRSEARTNAEAQQTDIMLLDTIGELAAVYRFAGVVFIGGSLVPRGGHNIIEPAVFAKPIIVGPHTQNFRQIVADFAQADAVVQVAATGEDIPGAFTQALSHLLTDDSAAQAMGARAREILMANRGATKCTIAAIRERLR